MRQLCVKPVGIPLFVCIPYDNFRHPERTDRLRSRIPFGSFVQRCRLFFDTIFDCPFVVIECPSGFKCTNGSSVAAPVNDSHVSPDEMYIASAADTLGCFITEIDNGMSPSLDPHRAVNFSGLHHFVFGLRLHY